ncbi:hypothetical protein C4J95_3188 [Pseudomonas orientalis]|nr:hypothetical protein C4J96_3089 [Pseudomonas orientalis]AZF00648.1 hypothetical protein C4J95_3188 [Pseudomonas orientalis]
MDDANQKCGRGLAPDGGVSVKPQSGASPLPHLVSISNL